VAGVDLAPETEIPFAGAPLAQVCISLSLCVHIKIGR